LSKKKRKIIGILLLNKMYLMNKMKAPTRNNCKELKKIIEKIDNKKNKMRKEKSKRKSNSKKMKFKDKKISIKKKR